MALKEGFSGSKDIVAYLDQNVSKFYGYFKDITSLLFEPAIDKNYNEDFQNFVKIFDCLPLMTTKLNKDISVIRARPNYNGKLYTNQSEISYHPEPHEIKAGRFNAPGVPIFYGSLPVPENDLNFSLTGCIESCKALISQDNPSELQDMTIGLWRLNEVMPVVNLCFDERHLATNPSLKEATIKYFELLSENYSKEDYEFILSFLGYFSKLSSTNMKNDECYYILSALFAAIRYYYIEKMKVPFTGVIFPSCATEGIELNTALVPQAVEHCLTLRKVVMYRFVLDKSKNEYKSLPCSDLIDVKNKIFKITNYH